MKKTQVLPPLISAIVGIAAVLFPSSYSLAEKPRIYQDTPKNTPTKTQPAKVMTTEINSNSADQKQRVYETKDWVVREQIDDVEKVNDALKVFQSRKIQVYDRKVWIYNKIIDHNDVYVDFVTNDFNKDIVFSPDEKFVYYLAYTQDGGNNDLYGLNLATEKKFLISAADEFSVQSCKGKNDIVVVSKKVGNHSYNSYYIFDLQGKQTNFIDQIGKPDDLKNVVCY